MFVKLSILASLLSAYHALRIEDNRPGAIPMLTREVSNMPGDWSKVLNKDYGSLNSELNRKIQQLENTNVIPGAPRHKVIKIKEAISQLVAGKNYKVVFTVGQLNNAPSLDQINQDGQYGQCYFELSYPLKRISADVKEHRCVKISKNEAN